MSFESIPLTDLIGSEVRVDKQTLLTPEVAQGIRRLLIERGVLIFKSLHLSDVQQIALSRLMGTVREEGDGGIFKVTLDKKANASADYLKGSFLWHLDGTHDDVPIFASLLSARTLSKTGGQTEFANTHVAYDELPSETKRRIENLSAVHSVEVSMLRAGLEPTQDNLASWRHRPVKQHKLVWTHQSGRKSLVIGSHASHIVGMDQNEGQKLIQELISWTTQPRFCYRHEWSPGDLLIWDNTGVLHRAEPYAADSGRIMHRTTLLGEEAFA
jgi:alpha-ketoglutarate-dependent taurine dioxygenase